MVDDFWNDDEDDDMTTTELTPRETTREMKKISVTLDRVTKHLFGNGEKGMDEILRNLDATVNNLQKSFEADKAERKVARDAQEKAVIEEKIWRKRFVIQTVVLTAIPPILTFIGWLVYWIFKLQPLLEKLQEQVK